MCVWRLIRSFCRFLLFVLCKAMGTPSFEQQFVSIDVFYRDKLKKDGDMPQTRRQQTIEDFMDEEDLAADVRTTKVR